MGPLVFFQGISMHPEAADSAGFVGGVAEGIYVRQHYETNDS